LSLLKFLKSREVSETPKTPCKVELSEKDIQCIIDTEKRKLSIHIHNINYNNCNQNKLFIKINLDSKEIVHSLKEWFHRRGILRYLPIIMIDLEEDEIGIEEIAVSIIEERQVEDRLWAIEVCEPITLPVKIIKPVKKFEEHVEVRAPVIEVPSPCKDDEHDWGVEYIFRNFRGDVVAILYRCRKCGRIKRETA
jgi:hypothetical protein